MSLPNYDEWKTRTPKSWGEEPITECCEWPFDDVAGIDVCSSCGYPVDEDGEPLPDIMAVEAIQQAWERQRKRAIERARQAQRERQEATK